MLLQPNHLTRNILLAMLFGAFIGIILHQYPNATFFHQYIVNGLLDIGGKLFMNILNMIIVPVVFVSIVNGICNLSDITKLGWVAGKTFSLYMFTTVLAIILGLIVAVIFQIGKNNNDLPIQTFTPIESPAIKDVIVNLIPKNPIAALAQGDMLQIIVFALLFGVAIALTKNTSKHIARIFAELNEVVMSLIHLMLRAVPTGVFCLITVLFATLGLEIINQLFSYFFTVVAVLFIQLLLVYSLLIFLFTGLNPIIFFEKMFTAMLFAFSVSSSNASMPVVLDTVKNKLGVNNTVASFVIPLGATINMDGTAIMQAIATVFIANLYHIDLTLAGYLTIILTALLASIGTAGVPSVGLITLTIILRQLNIPVEGIAIIIGVDRLLDMLRTTVNITGDAVVAYIVGVSEKMVDQKILQR